MWKVILDREWDREFVHCVFWLTITCIIWNSNFVPLLEGRCSSNPCTFEFSVFLWVFGQSRTDEIKIDSSALWPTELYCVGGGWVYVRIRTHLQTTCGAQGDPRCLNRAPLLILCSGKNTRMIWSKISGDSKSSLVNCKIIVQIWSFCFVITGISAFHNKHSTSEFPGKFSIHNHFNIQV